MRLYITDKSNQRFWDTSVSAGHASGERNNLRRYLERIQAGAQGFQFVDAATARLVEEHDDHDEQPEPMPPASVAGLLQELDEIDALVGIVKEDPQ